MEEIELLQRNLEKAQKKQEPHHVNSELKPRINLASENLREYNSRDNSPQRDISPTEEYWTNFNQAKTNLKSREMISPNKERISKMNFSRSSSRLSAANEILFGNAGKNGSLLGSNQSSPTKVPLLNALSTKSDIPVLNAGFSSYINRQEQLVNFKFDGEL